MGVQVRAGDENVVQVDENEGQVDAQPVHHALEGVASVPEAKGHGKPLEQTKGGDDRGLGDVPLGHGDLVVPLDKVQLGEVAATVQPIGEVVDVGHGVQEQ